MEQHSFTSTIQKILENHFGIQGNDIFLQSDLLQYINIKTKSASSRSKARSSFANLYAIYVLLEDYIGKGFVASSDAYPKSEGAIFSKMLQRIRQLPFGEKMQNHALNSRLNEEFKKYFIGCEFQPIIRNLESKRYWICENLIKVQIAKKTYNTAEAIIDIINAYIKAKQNSFHSFTTACRNMRTVSTCDEQAVVEYILSLLEPNVDARIFEIVSYAILKFYYSDMVIYWGWNRESIEENSLALYKTGRTNANDGGIDFVMKPLGRFFQVTETLDLKKYFLDIDKVQRYPISFVIKTDVAVEKIKTDIENKAQKIYSIEKIVKEYMECIEEIINIPMLVDFVRSVMKNGRIVDVFDEIIHQSEIEFNFSITELTYSGTNHGKFLYRQ